MLEDAAHSRAAFFVSYGSMLIWGLPCSSLSGEVYSNRNFKATFCTEPCPDQKKIRTGSQLVRVTLVGEPLLVEADENIDSTKTFLERWSTLILVLRNVSVAAGGDWGPFVLSRFLPTDIRQWLPSGFAEAVTYDWFQNEFGVDEMVVVSWRGCQLDDPRVTALREALEEQSNDEGPIFEPGHQRAGHVGANSNRSASAGNPRYGGFAA